MSVFVFGVGSAFEIVLVGVCSGLWVVWTGQEPCVPLLHARVTWC